MSGILDKMISFLQPSPLFSSSEDPAPENPEQNQSSSPTTPETKSMKENPEFLSSLVCQKQKLRAAKRKKADDLQGKKKEPSKMQQGQRFNKKDSDNMGKQSYTLPKFMKQQRVPDIKIREVHLPFGSEERYAVYLENIFSAEESEEIIKFTEDQLKYEKALLNYGRGKQVYRPDVRDHDRTMVDAPDFAAYLFERVKPYLPKTFHLRALDTDKPIAGLNERLRFLRYGKGNYFAPHYDGSYTRDNGSESSYVTVLLYLNDTFTGGQTNFLGHREEPFTVKPTQGGALIFEHQIYHEGAMLTDGQKYLLRTDVMYHNNYAQNQRAKKNKLTGKKKT